MIISLFNLSTYWEQDQSIKEGNIHTSAVGLRLQPPLARINSPANHYTNNNVMIYPNTTGTSPFTLSSLLEIKDYTIKYRTFLWYLKTTD